jgi:hypothetical protein
MPRHHRLAIDWLMVDTIEQSIGYILPAVDCNIGYFSGCSIQSLLNCIGKSINLLLILL